MAVSGTADAFGRWGFRALGLSRKRSELSTLLQKELMPVVTELARLRQEYLCETEASLGFPVRPCALQELEDLKGEMPPYLRDLCSEKANVLVWHMLLLPVQPPYNLKAFRLRLDFPREYPFRPPMVTFTTRIYHPNVDEQGRSCLPLLSRENWKPHTKAAQVLEALSHLVNRPNLEEPLRLDLANLLAQSPELFWKKAEEFTLQFGEDRPS